MTVYNVDHQSLKVLTQNLRLSGSYQQSSSNEHAEVCTTHWEQQRQVQESIEEWRLRPGAATVLRHWCATSTASNQYLKGEISLPSRVYVVRRLFLRVGLYHELSYEYQGKEIAENEIAWVIQAFLRMGIFLISISWPCFPQLPSQPVIKGRQFKYKESQPNSTVSSWSTSFRDQTSFESEAEIL
jgi:hypothetical protein